MTTSRIRLVGLSLPAIAVALAGLLLPTNAAANHTKSKGKWTAPCPAGLSCMPEGREGFAMTRIGDQLVVSHGLTQLTGDSNHTRIYDIATDTWFDPMPVPPLAIRSELAGAAHGGIHYAVGGRGSCAVSLFGVCADLEAYDRVANAWTSLRPMPTPRAGLATAVVGNRLFAIGGRTGTTPASGVALTAVEAYNIVAGTWRTVSPLPVAVMDTFAVSHGGRIYVIGGATMGNVPVGLVQIYNVAKNRWSLGSPMPTPRANLALAKCGSVILALGGRLDLGVSTIVEAYEIPKNAWKTGLAPMPTAKSEHAAAFHGGRIYATGSGIFGAARNYHEAARCSSFFGKRK